MAKRKHNVFNRLDTADVQGEGSFVVMRKPKYSDVTELVNTEGGLTPRQLGMAILPRLVVSWNWVDDDDKPLPQPNGDPKVFDLLATEEYDFLLSNIKILGAQEAKN